MHSCFPIATAPRALTADGEPETLLLWCPDLGGWHAGLWWEGWWRLAYDIEIILTPTRWRPAPPRPEEEEDDGPGGHELVEAD